MRAVTAALVAVLLAAGCGQPLAPEASVAGVYELQSVDGSPVPFLLSPAPKIEILARSLVLDEMGRFVDRMELRVVTDDATYRLPTEKAGEYFVDGSELSLVYATGRRAESILRRDVISLDDRGLIFRLER